MSDRPAIKERGGDHWTCVEEVAGRPAFNNSATRLSNWFCDNAYLI